ncbi:hypothetical protein VTO42DRAFT_6259 [Malbranchea cinnamomea]
MWQGSTEVLSRKLPSSVVKPQVNLTKKISNRDVRYRSCWHFSGHAWEAYQTAPASRKNTYIHYEGVNLAGFFYQFDWLTEVRTRNNFDPFSSENHHQNRAKKSLVSKTPFSYPREISRNS